MKRKMICICCPAGCHLETDDSVSGEIVIEGNRCPRGKDYGVEEMTAPRRVVTAVVRSDSKSLRYIPVRTSAPLPREKAGSLLRELYRIEAKTPVSNGEALISDFENTGIDVIFTRGIGK